MGFSMSLDLIEFSKTPNLLKNIIISKGLAIKEYPVGEWQNLIPTENYVSYCNGLKTGSSLTVFAMSSEHLFYSILFPNYNTHQINQLQFLLSLAKSILKKGSINNRINFSKFIFSKSCSNAITSNLSVTYINNKICLTSYSGVTFEDSLKFDDLFSLSFDTLYNTILNDFNLKVQSMLKSDTHIVDTDYIIHLQTETNEDFIKRTHHNGISNPLRFEEFQNYIEKLNITFISESSGSQINYDNKKALHFINDGYKKVYIFGIQQINYLKILLKPLVKNDNLEKLINLFSIAQFYSSLFYSGSSTNVIEFTHLDIFNLSKVLLSKNPEYFEISVGKFIFKIGEIIRIYNFVEDKIELFSTVDLAYDYLYHLIYNTICLKLNTEPCKVTNKDILVLNMMTY